MLYINGQLVTRPPKGFNYTGTYDVPRETLLRMDAISKGFVPSSFDYRTESGERGIVDGIGGMYDERGVYHDRNGTSAFGSRKASDSLGKQVGLTTTKVEQILAVSGQITKRNYQRKYKRHNKNKLNKG